MLNVARRSQEYIAENMNAEAIVKLKLILSYLTLYLTLEYRILAGMHAHERIFISDRALDSRRLEVLQTGLSLRRKSEAWYAKGQCAICKGALKHDVDAACFGATHSHDLWTSCNHTLQGEWHQHQSHGGRRISSVG